MILSFRILLYNFFLAIFVPFVLKPANRIRFGVTPDQATNLTSALAIFTACFGLYVDPNSYSTPIVNDMNVAYFNCFQLTEAIRKQIKNNLLITLSGIERLILSIPVPVPRRNNVSVPDIQPVGVCILKASLLMRFICFDPTNPFRRAKPPGAFSIGYKTVIVPTGSPAPNIKDYIAQNPEKNTEFEVLFTSPQVGETLYIICYYISNRGEVGKDGPVYSVVII